MLSTARWVVGGGRWALDKRASVDLGAEEGNVLYIDNFAVASVDQARAEGGARVIQGALAERGVVGAVEITSTEKAELLGCELDLLSGRWHVRPKRF